AQEARVPDAGERESLIRRYEEGPDRLKSAFAKVPEEARQWRPAPGKWSAHEIVCHCADSETNASLRIRTLTAEKEPVIVGYDQDEWAARFDYHSHPVDKAMSAVEAVRANTVPLLRRLPEASWAKVGRHTESGTYSAEDWLRIYAEHLEKHSRQIERNLELWRARSAAGR
ncbi:MAG TPA: DinB family protein, partial [Vicinamibacteria bacterium]